MIVVKDAPTSLELMRALKILMDMSIWPLVSAKLRACQDAIKSGKWSEAIKQLKQVSNGGKTGAAKEVAKTRLLARGLIDRIKQIPRKPKEVPAFMLKIEMIDSTDDNNNAFNAWLSDNFDKDALKKAITARQRWLVQRNKAILQKIDEGALKSLYKSREDVKRAVEEFARKINAVLEYSSFKVLTNDRGVIVDSVHEPDNDKVFRANGSDLPRLIEEFLKDNPTIQLLRRPQREVTNSELVSEINSVIDNYVGQVQKALEILKPMVDRRKKELPIDPQAAARVFMNVANDQPEIAELFNNKWRNAVDTREEKVAYSSAIDRFKKWRAKLGKTYRLLDPYGLIIKYT